MPAINMFGRRWALAADDVPVLALPAAIFHAVWFIFLVIGFSAIQKPSSCSNTASYESCIIGLFICFFLSALLESWLVREGMKGCQHPGQLILASMLFEFSHLHTLQAAYLKPRSASESSLCCMLRLPCLWLK